MHRGLVGVEESVLADEFEQVKNAFYIDPKDQSAFFYHRWLLGRTERAPVVCHVGAVAQHCASRAPGVALVLCVFSQPVWFSRDDCARVELATGADPPASPLAHGKWEPCAPLPSSYTAAGARSSAAPTPSKLWRLALTASCCGKELQLHFDGAAVQTADGTPLGGACDFVVAVPPEASAPDNGEAPAVLSPMAEDPAPWRLLQRYAVPREKRLQQELETVEELQDELEEEEKKWTLLSLVYILTALDAEAHHDRIVDTLNQYDRGAAGGAVLAGAAPLFPSPLTPRGCNPPSPPRLLLVDPYRKAYYEDLLCTCAARHSLCLDVRASHGPPLGDVTALARTDMSVFAHPEHYCFVGGTLDLGGNLLRGLSFASMLVCASTLVLDDNLIAEVPEGCFGADALPSLRVLSLRRNKLRRLRDLRGLEALQQLASLALDGNPVASLAGFGEYAASSLPPLCP